MRHLCTSSLSFLLVFAGCVDSPPPLNPGVDAGSATPTADAAPQPDGRAPAIDPFEEWAGCMTQANWDAAKMGSWANKTSSFGTICADCHGDGLKHFYTNLDNAQMFQYNRLETFITGFFTIAPDENGVNAIVPAFDKIERKGNGDNNHPLFAVGQGDQYFKRLDQFAELTRQRKEAGLCDPPGYPPPPVQQ